MTRGKTAQQKWDTEWKLVDCRQSFIPNTGQVKAAPGSDGVPAWLLK